MVYKSDLVIIGISVGLALGILIASLICCGLRWFKKCTRVERSAKEQHITTLPIRTYGIGKYGMLHKILPHVGTRSFGPVYKATMLTGDVVAVKVLASDSKQGKKEFQTEVLLLGRLHHRNLVNLVGYCVDKGQHMLIYEFMSSGEQRVLNWDERLQISLDISHGDEYLHEGANPPIIRRDLKTANIQLDQSMRAKVADFGLSKEEVFDGRNSGLKGTHGTI